MGANFRAILPIASVYPEMLHKFVVINASRSLCRLSAICQPLMKRLFKSWHPSKFNEHEFVEQEGKLKLIGIGDWEAVAELLPPQTVLAWAEDIAPTEPH